jgi:hypothetical protein
MAKATDLTFDDEIANIRMILKKLKSAADELAKYKEPDRPARVKVLIAKTRLVILNMQSIMDTGTLGAEAQKEMFQNNRALLDLVESMVEGQEPVA